MSAATSSVVHALQLRLGRRVKRWWCGPACPPLPASSRLPTAAAAYSLGLLHLAAVLHDPAACTCCVERRVKIANTSPMCWSLPFLPRLDRAAPPSSSRQPIDPAETKHPFVNHFAVLMINEIPVFSSRRVIGVSSLVVCLCGSAKLSAPRRDFP